MARTVRLFDMRGGELPTNSGSPLLEIGPKVVRKHPNSPNPCILVNARRGVTIHTAKGEFTILSEKLKSPILVLVYEDGTGKVEDFWIPNAIAGDRAMVPEDANNLQLGKFTFVLPIFQD